MAIMNWIVNGGLESRSIENPSVPISAFTSFLFGGGMSNSGAVVTTDSALRLSPVWQAVSLITGDISRMPCITYRRGPDRGPGLPRGKQHATDHPTYSLLWGNTGEMTSNLWVRRMLAHALLYGNAFSRIYRNTATGPRRPYKMEWLHRDQVIPRKEGGRFFYEVIYDFERNGKNGIVRLPPTDMFHLVGLTIDELGGLSLIDYARNCFGRQASTERYSDDFYRNNSVPQGWFVHPSQMSKPAQDRFREQVEKRHQGAGNHHKVGILEEDMKWVPTGITPKDALMVEALALGVNDCSRFFNIPSHKLGNKEKVNYNSLEQENQSYIDSTLGFWFDGFECEATDKLLHSEERAGRNYFVKFDMSQMLRASTEVRYAAHSIALTTRMKTPNEVRDEEDLPPVDGGDEFLPLPNESPDNKADNDDADTDITDEDDRGSHEIDERREQVLIAARDALVEALNRMGKLVSNVATRAAKDPSNWFGFTDNGLFEHRDKVKESLEAPIRILAALRSIDHQSVLDQCVGDYFGRWRSAMLEASECSADALPQRVAAASQLLVKESITFADTVVFGRKEGES